ncbi:MAG: putative ABC transporter permease [Ruminococcus sp.]|nr:putative ABC transporter permease [Ruminococcus sp.]
MFYINIFFIYSFLGFLFENGLSLVMNTNFNSGVLYGPWTFIYGIAIFVIMIYDKFLKQFKLNKWLEVLLLYLGVTVLMTLIEFSGGMLIEKLFHVVYWDYINLKFNFGHYIALEISLLWGLFATFVNYLLAPIINKLAKKIPVYITIIFIVLFVTDIIITIIN